MYTKLLLVIVMAIACSYLTYDSHFPANYEAGTAVKKQDQLWNLGLADKGVPGEFATGLAAAALVAPVALGGQDFTPVGHNDSDENAWSRRKLIHSVGDHAKIKIQWTPNNGYTGAFAEKESIGIVRCSSATAPTAQNNAPGFGLKIFRDGVPSGNLVAMWRLQGQDNTTNFFEHDFSNHVSQLPRFK